MTEKTVTETLVDSEAHASPPVSLWEAREILDAAWRSWKAAEEAYYVHAVRRYVSAGVAGAPPPGHATLLNPDSLGELEWLREQARLAQLHYQRAVEQAAGAGAASTP